MLLMDQPMSVLTSHKTVEWHTPSEIIEMVREVLGVIWLDPASDPVPQQWIKAMVYFSEGGLTRAWPGGPVFCNPPYGKSKGFGSNQAAWSYAMMSKYRAGEFLEGILLVNSTHGYKWYEELVDGRIHCLARERIRFIKPDGSVGGRAKRGQTFVYFGADPTKFIRVFSGIGRIIRP